VSGTDQRIVTIPEGRGMVEVVRPIAYIRTIHTSLSTEPHSVKPQVNRPERGSRLPAEVSAAWWSPRSSNSVSLVQGRS
jgi:hypothetical protein